MNSHDVTITLAFVFNYGFNENVSAQLGNRMDQDYSTLIR